MNRYSKYVNVDELKKARKNKKMTCEDVSKEMGFKSPVSYYNIEEGIVEPKISQMMKILKYFAMVLGYISLILIIKNIQAIVAVLLEYKIYLISISMLLISFGSLIGTFYIYVKDVKSRNKNSK